MTASSSIQQSRPLKACIIVPTYNEAGNVEVLLNRIFANAAQHGPAANVDLHVLIVDDNSPDGTAKVVQNYQTHNNHLHLLSRTEKNGLGAAYIAGMTHAMATLKPDVVFEMDADLSHNPDDIFRLIAEIKNGADFVIGSRYVPGGSIPADWGAHRKLISKSANLYSRLVLNLSDVRDCTGGFRAIRTSALKTIDFSTLSSKGYAFQVSLLDAILRNGFTVREVPIAFSDRTIGSSKMRFKDMAEGGITLLRLRARNMLRRPSTVKQSNRKPAHA
jgi:dolichol-phosphate mannosyltransferase